MWSCSSQCIKSIYVLIYSLSLILIFFFTSTNCLMHEEAESSPCQTICILCVYRNTHISIFELVPSVHCSCISSAQVAIISLFSLILNQLFWHGMWIDSCCQGTKGKILDREKESNANYNIKQIRKYIIKRDYFKKRSLCILDMERKIFCKVPKMSIKFCI